MYVYVITNLINEKIYVGQHAGDDLDRYFRGDLTRATLNNGDRKPHLYKAVRKYGIDKFVISPLVICKTKEEMDAWEIHFIKAFGSNDKKVGYNIAAGGGGSCGYTRVVSEETRQKMSENGKKRRHSVEERQKMSAAMVGIPKSNEHRRKLSESKLGKKRGPFSEEHKNKIRMSLLGKRHSKERVEKQRASIIKHYADIKVKEIAQCR